MVYFNSLSLTQHEHGGDDDVGHDGEGAEDEMGAAPEACLNNLEESLGSGGSNLHLH